MSFKIPSTVPQDLLLIQEMVSTSPTPEKNTTTKAKADSSDSSGDSTSSSDSDSDSDSSSEDESKIEATLQVVRTESDTEDLDTLKDVAPSPTEDSDDSDSDSSDSDSEEDKPRFVRKMKEILSDDDEDDEGGGVSVPASGIRSKNEIAEKAILPDLETIGPDERLEKVGEIMSVIESVVVVRGIPSNTKNASERALDSESLLVFEDRKVLGYVHETFGPTQQPFYQIKFPSPLAINSELVTVGKAVFHLPDRSNFVFPSQLRMFKGSDASNVHDEEVGEDELEFSDDETEIAFKKSRKHARARSSSVASSRFSTPQTWHTRDQDFMAETSFDGSPYDDYNSYDTDSEAGPSRPVPLPYDDPYQDAPRPPSPTPSVISDAQSSIDDRSVGYGDQTNYGHGYSRGRGRGRGGGRGRGRGRDNGPGYRGRGDRRGGRDGGESRPLYQQRGRERSRSISNPSVPPSPRSLSPTSFAIARATGQYSDGSAFQQSAPSPIPPSPHEPQSAPWNTQGSFVQFAAAQQGYNAQQQQQQYQQPAATDYVQPHINPRFASMFGFNMNFMHQQEQQQQYSPYQSSMYGNSWNGAWVPPTGTASAENMSASEKGSQHSMDTSGDSKT